LDKVKINLEECFKYVDKNSDKFVRIFRSMLQIPSVSADITTDPKAPVRTCGRELVRIMTERRIDTHMFELENGWPLVYGSLHSPNTKKTLIGYGHYDVMPIGPRDQWLVDPFTAEMVTDVIVARGACDNKGGVMAQVFAAEAILETQGEVPVNWIFVFDGEEELGSPHLTSWVKANQDELLNGNALYNIDKWGFNRLTVARIGSREPPVSPELNDAFAHLVAKAATKVFGFKPEVNDWSADSIFGMGMMKQIPAIMTGFGTADHNIHKPNERVPIADFIRGIKYVISLIGTFAEEWEL